MTPKEAIEYLNIMKLSTEDDSVGEIKKKKKEVCRTAIEALEKQIPKKPVYYTFGKEKYPKCPCCGDGWNMNEYGNGMVHCWECGQFIDWSEKE